MANSARAIGGGNLTWPARLGLSLKPINHDENPGVDIMLGCLRMEKGPRCFSLEESGIQPENKEKGILVSSSLMDISICSAMFGTWISKQTSGRTLSNCQAGRCAGFRLPRITLPGRQSSNWRDAGIMIPIPLLREFMFSERAWIRVLLRRHRKAPRPTVGRSFLFVLTRPNNDCSASLKKEFLKSIWK